MKKRFLSVLVIAMLLTSTLFGCSQSNLEYADIDFATNASLVRVNTFDDTWVSFSLFMVSNEKITDFDVVAVEGDNVELSDFEFSTTDSYTKELEHYSYKGLFAKYSSFEFKLINDTVKDCTFDSITINVNGKNRKIDFEPSLKNDFSKTSNFSGDLESNVIPNSMHSSIINTSDTMTYRFSVKEDLVINDIYYFDFLKPDNITYSLNNSEHKKLEFPLSLNANDSIEISFSVTSEEVSTQDEIYTNLIFDYTSKKDNIKQENSFYLSFSPLEFIPNNDMSIFDNLIDAMI